MSFAENLKRLRKEQFLSQAELARRAGVSKLTIQRLEAGAAAPYAKTVRQLAEALSMAPGDLAHPSEVAEAKRVA
jgi:transcriptional regulator with XRE-family HTH domain